MSSIRKLGWWLWLPAAILAAVWAWAPETPEAPGALASVAPIVSASQRAVEIRTPAAQASSVPPDDAGVCGAPPACPDPPAAQRESAAKLRGAERAALALAEAARSLLATRGRELLDAADPPWEPNGPSTGWPTQGWPVLDVSVVGHRVRVLEMDGAYQARVVWIEPGTEDDGYLRALLRAWEE